ncbi:MAG: excisionase family DNA-binding protein [Candidatus Krumholzibacteria bacterium]|nr:excisionase family DNA-binding protein [Candidatus Krumholzibacteria bacterium]
MSLKHLSTGQAAAILSVTPDTVLKWIRLGRLPASRTAGGHHRIDRKDLDLVTTGTRKQNPASTDPHRRSLKYCWEFYGNGDLPEKCRGCAVYLMRAQRCYEVAKLAPQSGHLKAYCEKTCDECEYYRLVHEQNANVLVVTDDVALAEKLKREAESRNFNLEIADCEYICSLKITKFRPDFAVVDCSLGRQASSDISRHLVQDPRIPSVRVVLAGKDDEFPEECDKEFFARMDRPFGIEEISEVVKRFV